MNLLQRFGYYLGGFSIGLVILAFFLNGKRVSCDYGPEARVLKNINSKKIVFSQNLIANIHNINIDSTSIVNIIKNGDIIFSKSNTRQKPCGVYFIEEETSKGTIGLSVENCDSIATVLKVVLKK